MARSRKRIKRSPPAIPEGLMLEILFLLPTKSLCRFGCVSKKWAAMISQRRPLLPMCGLYLDYEQVHIYTSVGDKQVKCYPRSRFYSKYDLLSVCNGLFLYRNQKATFNYCVTNPATKECVLLPKCRGVGKSYSFLAYDPRESPHYKVLRFIQVPKNKSHVGIEMLSSITHKWVRGILRTPISPKSWNFGSAYLNGSLYILIKRASCVLEFHVKRGQFKVITLAKTHSTRSKSEGHDNSVATCIGISRGHIYCAEINFSRCVMKIMKLTREGNTAEWIKEYLISIKAFVGNLMDCPKDEIPANLVKPLGFHPDSEDVYLLMRDKVFSYHPRSGRFDELCTLTITRFPVSWLTTFAVTPSLESIGFPGSTILKWQSTILPMVKKDEGWMKNKLG